MSEVAKVLTAAREKIERPECWTRGSYARDIVGMSVTTQSKNATCFCARGALFAVRKKFSRSDYSGAYKCLIPELGLQSLVEFNDSHTHAEVIDLFDRAIAAAEGAKL